MLRINQIKLPIAHSEVELSNKIRKELKLNNKVDFEFSIVKKSIDARKKPDLFYVYSVNVKINEEDKILKRARNKSVSIIKEKIYKLPQCGSEELRYRPVVVGAGPAGLFCAYIMTEAGYLPLVIERGKQIKQRKADVEEFWKTGVLNTASNVQFGEGGAGTFSDGKLNTVVKDPSGRNKYVLETFVRFGAPENILYDNKPHIGTDVLAEVIVNMRNYLISKGCEFCFETQMTDLIIENNVLKSVVCNEKVIDSNILVLALGHSSRDTFKKLDEHKLFMESKNFAVGFRVEHPQEMINKCMYGDINYKLPAAPYKVTSNFPNGRGVYSFCMCPGGYVVNSSSEENRLVVNGMSYSGRNGKNANSAIIVSVGPEDFGASGALAGMYYQMKLEEATYRLGNGKIPQQLYGDYCKNIASKSYGDFDSQSKGATVFANLHELMSYDMTDSFIKGMQHFGHLVPGFDRYDAILSGMETRTSSPVRIVRDENYESSVKGIYPCGEGAGYAGGITSAAMDGIKVAEAIIMRYRPNL